MCKRVYLEAHGSRELESLTIMQETVAASRNSIEEVTESLHLDLQVLGRET